MRHTERVDGQGWQTRADLIPLTRGATVHVIYDNRRSAIADFNGRLEEVNGVDACLWHGGQRTR